MEPVAPSQRSLRTRRPLRNTARRDTVAFEGQARVRPRICSPACFDPRRRWPCHPARNAPPSCDPCPSTCATSVATTSKTAAGEAPRATSVATRRSAACSSASRAASARASVFEIAVATSCGELLDARRGFRGQRLGLPRQGNHGAPESAFDDDRRADRRANAYAARPRRDRARRIRVIVEPRRPPRPMHAGGDALPFQRHAGADRNADVLLAPDCDDGGNAVRLEAVLERVLDAQ